MYRIELSRKKMGRTLFLILGLLLFAHLSILFCHFVLHTPVRALTLLFDLDTEANVPTLFNVALFFLGAFLFFLQGRSMEPKHRFGWFLMAAVFVFLGIDEGAQIHERFILFTRNLLEAMMSKEGDHGWLYFAWVVPYGLAVLGLAVVLWRWFKGLEPRLMKGLVISGVIYIFGAVFMEMVNGKIYEPVSTMLESDTSSPLGWVAGLTPLPAPYAYVPIQLVASSTLEETCEMTGLILCSLALMGAFERRRLRLAISVEDGDLPIA